MRDCIVPTIRFHARMPRWVGGLVGCALAALAMTASRLDLGAHDPEVAWLAVFAAVWLAWAAFDFAFAPLRAARAEEHRFRPEAIASQPVFVDTEATWRSP